MSGVDPAFEGTRLVYDGGGLVEGDVAPDPFVQLRRWLDDAVAAAVAEPTALTLSTVDADGQPHSRTVLMRRFDASGLVFFTNLGSAKAQEIGADPRAAVQLLWLDLHRQVRVEGLIEAVSDAESDEYFATRPRESQLGAWSSPQSEVISSRAELEARVAQVTSRFDGVDGVPRPPDWGGFRLVPDSFEFWQGRPNRLHDRMRYRSGADGSWIIERLAP